MASPSTGLKTQNVIDKINENERNKSINQILKIKKKLFIK